MHYLFSLTPNPPVLHHPPDAAVLPDAAALRSWEVLRSWKFAVDIDESGAIARTWFVSGAEQSDEQPDAPADIPELAAPIAAALRAWARGEAHAFAALPLHPAATAFAADIRRALMQIPLGEVVTYAELAARAGHPHAIRAAASACAHNPLPLIVPCHRVVPAASTRTSERATHTPDYGNYAFGRALKSALITWEKAAKKAG